MECAFDAQNLISISLRKIQSSRTQRGGIKLHKNLLVTYVLRNARQFYMSKNFPQAQRIHQYEDAAAVRQTHDYLALTGSFTELADDFYCNFGGVESDTWHCGAHQASGGHPDTSSSSSSPCAMVPPGDCGELMVSDACWSCAEKSSWELPVPNAQQAHQKTVLDLDTHVVTTVTNGYFHSDCCAQTPPRQQQQSYTRKRKMDSSCFHVVDPEFYLPDFGPVPCKRVRTEEDFHAESSEQLDTANISNLISVLGSGGLSEFVSWQQQTDLEHIFAAQTICLKHTLLSGGGWTRAIEAF
ncbi:immediate early response gene 5-like protein [Diretmus argenteus]